MAMMNNMSSSSSSSSSRNTDLQITSNNFNFQMPVDNNQQQSPQPPDTILSGGGAITPPPQETFTNARSSSSLNGNGKSVDDVWKEIVTTACKQEEVHPEDHHDHQMMMTLEDFLAKAGASTTVEEQLDDKIPPLSLHSLPSGRLLSGGRIFSFDNPPQPNVNVNLDGGFGITGVDDMSATGGVGGSGKRRALYEPLLLDKAAQQRQKRMIKNRESAARSRERKQAYQTELESLALKLEQENRTLSIAKMEQSRRRYKQLMDNIIPVTEKRRPTRYVLRKVRSMEW